MINKNIFKKEFLRLDNKTFDKKYRLFDKKIIESDVEILKGFISLLDRIQKGNACIEDYPDTYKHLIEKEYGIKK